MSNFSNLEVINLSGNKFGGALPRELCKFNLWRLHLSHNKFSGSIPACYVNIKNLISLHLQSNNLVGSIRRLNKSRSFLTRLDLRDNNLSGNIPDWFDTRSPSLRALLLVVIICKDLNLSGIVPTKGQLGAFDDSSYIGNPFLSVHNSNRGNRTIILPPSSPTSDSEDESVIDITSFYWTFAATYVTVS
ncbi:hypothetical protein L6164_002835 [Bauhinia variegata]|uniref:Uncharacterized protein n=1 Tax=Bauhinia variegata TaxID=167791 RepID=A0ACB9Q4X4_BAUVA|nr:hypothetical protein L6164_002835 [Bauhinia variegata]